MRTILTIVMSAWILGICSHLCSAQTGSGSSRAQDLSWLQVYYAPHLPPGMRLTIPTDPNPISVDQDARPHSDRLHVIAVIDTDTHNAEKLGIAIDGRTIKAFFSDKLPSSLRNRVSLTVLEGPDANANSIANAFRSIGQVPNDSVMFYYSGHGGSDRSRDAVASRVTGLPLGVTLDADNSHFLAMRHDNIWRTTIKSWVSWTRARGRYIITDCCENFPNIEAAEKAGVKSTNGGVGKIGSLSSLRTDDRFEQAFEKFFMSRAGWVSMNACPIGDTASGSTAGGAYSNSLFKFIANGTLTSHPYAGNADDQWDANTIRYFGRWDLAHERVVGDHVSFANGAFRQIGPNQFLAVPDFARRQGYRGGVLFTQ